jgi:hypothetical protein
VSVYLALHTSASPNLGDVAEFGRLALALGADPDSSLAVQRESNGALTVVLPIPDEVAR